MAETGDYRVDMETPAADAAAQHTPPAEPPADPEEATVASEASMLGVEVPEADAFEQALPADAEGDEDEEWPHAEEEASEPPWMD